ncbi:MAG: hypothetical protein WCL44_03265 [bacterium]
MRIRLVSCASVVSLVLVASSALADYGVSVKVGTLGIGVDVTRDLTDTLNGRLGFNMFSYDYSGTGGGEDGKKADEISAELRLLSVPLLLDWHPWENGVRFSVGAAFNQNEVSLSVVPGNTVDLNDNEYAVSSLDGKVSFNPVAPYIGIGWGDSAEKANGSWHFSFDLGVMFQGAPKVDLSATAAVPDQQAALNVDLAEEKKSMEEDTKMFTMYPVLSLGISYTF